MEDFATRLVGVWFTFGWRLVGVWLPFGWCLLPFWFTFATLLVGVWLLFGCLLVAFWLNVNEFNIRAMKNGRFCYPFGWRLVHVWLAFGWRLVHKKGVPYSRTERPNNLLTLI